MAQAERLDHRKICLLHLKSSSNNRTQAHSTDLSDMEGINGANGTPGAGDKRTAQQASETPKPTPTHDITTEKPKQADTSQSITFDSLPLSIASIIRLTHSTQGAIPMTGEDGYDAALHTLLCLGCAFRGYMSTRRQAAQRYVETLIVTLPWNKHRYEKADSQSKLRFDALLSSVQLLGFPEKAISKASWAYSHAKQGIGLMYAAEPAKLQWAMAALDEFAALPPSQGQKRIGGDLPGSGE
ncbi:hypothetical protein LTR17_016912 [Elasticomyces elasticus]|nr:hypothetical protein LTR17_016912 [Elasticomyces elasticus]